MPTQTDAWYEPLPLKALDRKDGVETVNYPETALNFWPVGGPGKTARAQFEL